MDDIVLTGSNSKGIISLKSFLYNQFHTKDLGMLKYFLSVEVMRSKKGIMLSQRKYVLDILYETRKLGAKPCSTPMAPNVQLTKKGELFDDSERYHSYLRRKAHRGAKAFWGLEEQGTFKARVFLFEAHPT